MGADGGSIPKRADLVKTQKRPLQEAPTNKADPWKYCGLSKQPLVAPIVACPRGRLYNKEAVLKRLLLRAAGDVATETDPLPHIRGLRDLRNLHLTPNPAYGQSVSRTTVQAGDRIDEATSPFVCPVTGKEMNGNFCFGYLRSCGCVMAKVALDKIKAVSTVEVCPQCGTRRSPDDFVILNDRNNKREKMTRPRVTREPLAEGQKESREARPPSPSSSLFPGRSPDPRPVEDLAEGSLGGMSAFRKTSAVASLYASNKLL